MTGDHFVAAPRAGDGSQPQAHELWVISFLLVVLLLTAGFVGVLSQIVQASCAFSPSEAQVARTPIQHVFFIIKENHAFENYFGTLPGVLGYPPNATLPTSVHGSGTIHPFPLSGSNTSDLPHDRASDLVDYNGGQNNLFVAQAAALGYPSPDDAAGYYTAQQIPDYFAYARSYALADRFFSGVLGPTLPNRIFDLAATSGNWTSDDPPPASAVGFPTILNQLEAAGVPWAYDYTGSATNLTPLLLPQVEADPCIVARILPITDFSAQLSSATPPSVTFVDASHDLATSEHPPSNVSYGEEWTVSVVNAIARSPVGGSSAIFVLWDESGGFWDPVTPPVRSPFGDGFRVPLLVLSPWTPEGLIVQSVLDPASLLRFVDENWALGFLNDRVATASSVTPFFDFTNAPRPWLVLPTPVVIPSATAPSPLATLPVGPPPMAATYRAIATDGRPLRSGGGPPPTG